MKNTIKTILKNVIFIYLPIASALLNGCKKPNDPESLSSDIGTAGYTIVKVYQTSGFAQDILIKDSLAYVAQGEGGLMIVNIKNPSNPLTIADISQGVRGYSTKIAMRDSVIYLAAGSYGVTVIDVANPFDPDVTAANLSMKPARNVYVYGDYLFTSVSEQGVAFAEISYPTQPDIRSGVYTNGYARGVVVTSDTNYLMVACGEMGLSIYDISDFQSGFGNYPQIAWCDTKGYSESIVLNEQEKLAYMACDDGGLQIIDYADTANVNIIGSYITDGVKEIAYKGNTVYLAIENFGLKIIDVSNPSLPRLIGEVETGDALGIAIDNDYIYLADEEQGIIIIAIP